MLFGIRSRNLSLGTFLALLCGPAGWGQTVVNTGSVVGTVSDQSGAVIAGATVILKANATETTLTHVSDRSGSFVFPALPVGQYALTVSASGFQTSETQGITVRVGQVFRAEIKLHPGTITGSIMVSATTPLLRTSDSTLSTVIDRKALEGLPLSGRRYTDFSLLTPNASPDGSTGLVSFAGEQDRKSVV